MGGGVRIEETGVQGVLVVASERFSDVRGSFARLYCDEELSAVIGQRRIIQINHSLTREKGTVRGMHFQLPPHAEMKLVRCLKGRVWDVAVDVRAGSPTFLQWRARELTPENGRMLVIPEGCAHGFQALEPDSELLYLHTASYHPEAEGALRHDDPRLAIPWPVPVTTLSERDRDHRPLAPDFTGISL